MLPAGRLCHRTCGGGASVFRLPRSYKGLLFATDGLTHRRFAPQIIGLVEAGEISTALLMREEAVRGSGETGGLRGFALRIPHD